MILDRNKRLLFTAWVVLVAFLSGLTGATFLFYLIIRLETDFPMNNIVIEKKDTYTVTSDERWGSLLEELSPSVLAVVKASKVSSKEMSLSGTDILGHALLVTNDGWVLVPTPLVRGVQSHTVEFVSTDKRVFGFSTVLDDEISGLSLVKLTSNNETDFKPVRLGILLTSRTGTGIALFSLDQSLMPHIASGIVTGMALKGSHDKLLSDRTYRYPLISTLGDGVVSNMQGESIAFVFNGNVLPLYAVKARLTSLLTQNKSNAVSLGITYSDRATIIASTVPIQGSRVVAVKKDSPASLAGIKEGDIITRIEDDEIRGLDDISQALLDFRPGQSLHIDYIRGTQRTTVDVKLGAL